jgi:hypothetical protein
VQENSIPLRACFPGEYEAQPKKLIYPNVDETITIFAPFLFCFAIFFAAAQAVHACTQYAFIIPFTRSLSSVSTKNIGFELPAQVTTASGACPSNGWHAASRASEDAEAVSIEKEYALRI